MYSRNYYKFIICILLCFIFRSLNGLETDEDKLSILLTGDTQYHFMCESDNIQCKKVSKRCREIYGLPESLSEPEDIPFNQLQKKGQELCIQLESRFANRVQRQAIDKFIGLQTVKPSAMLINGDLTNFGHLEQLQEFKNGWYNNFSVPLLLGLGNHDYQNNVEDCFMNFCAFTMISWFAEYGKNHSLLIDIKKVVNRTFDIKYTGTLAYTKRVCSENARNCAYVIQLNNAVDYSTYFDAFFVSINLTAPLNYLQRELTLLSKANVPILVNMHKGERMQRLKVKLTISNWISKRKAIQEEDGHKMRIPKIGVFFAHIHQNHHIDSYCINGYKVPFMYVGSVPNNRFSFLEISKDNAKVTGYKAKDNVYHNGNLLEELENYELWGPCEDYDHQTFMDNATRRRRQELRNITETTSKLFNF